MKLACIRTFNLYISWCNMHNELARDYNYHELYIMGLDVD